jgi:DNA-binding response OmpR family regulator
MRILIVDDEESITEVFQLILEDEGYKVDTASSGQEALSLSESQYDLVVLDIGLRDISGGQVAKVILKRHTDVKIVLMTGYPELVESKWALDIDIADILVKPFSPDVLQRLIREVPFTK